MTSAGHILLADDEPTFLNSTADLLRAEGYTCETAPDGESALAQVKAQQFDLLITDLEMPGNSDLELVRKVAVESGGLPVIILTGYPSVRSAVACIELPVAAYLTKPVSFAALLERVASSVQALPFMANDAARRRATDVMAERLPTPGEGQRRTNGAVTRRVSQPHAPKRDGVTHRSRSYDARHEQSPGGRNTVPADELPPRRAAAIGRG